MNVIPGINMAMIAAIVDPNTKQVMRQIVDGLNVRNGASGSGENRFVTAGELGNLSGKVGGLALAIKNVEQRKTETFITPAQINRIIDNLQAQIFESLLFKELGERIDAIDLSIVAEQQARIAAVQQLADDLAAEAEARLGFEQVVGSDIRSLQFVDSSQALLISGLTTRTATAESTIITLERTTADQAVVLTQLDTRVGGAESEISTLSLTTGEQALTLTSLSSRTTAVEGVAAAAESSISTLNRTTAEQALTLTAMSSRIGNTESAITEESTTRANADNAITQSVDTRFSTVGQSISAIQNTLTTTANSVSSLSSEVTTLSADVGRAFTSIQQEATARANADGDLYSKYSVKIDQNGYVSGFGLMSTANNSVPFSEFIVRADRFAIASPSGPGVNPSVPFIVTTTPQTMPDGTVIPPGVYLDSLVAKKIDGAFINAGLLYAASVYTGSQYVDINSRLPVLAKPSVCEFRTSLVPDASTNYVSQFSTRLAMYGPDWHRQVPIYQRVRHQEPGDQIRFTVSASAIVDAYLSIWYRLRSYIPDHDWPTVFAQTMPNIRFSQWLPLNAWIEEKQNDYGSASITLDFGIYMFDDQYIEFTIAPTRLNVGSGYSYLGVDAWTNPDDWAPWQTDEVTMYDASISISASNL
jgi:Domain of unknown function (DUF1983)